MTLRPDRPPLTAALAPAALAPAALALTVGAPAAVTTPRPITLAMIGTGGAGLHNLGRFLACPEARVVAVCDADRRQLAPAITAVNKQYGDTACRATADFRDLLTDPRIDAVCLSTPDHWHAALAVAAARAGKDIYCEAPLAHTIAGGRAICEAVATHGRILQTGSEERSHPRVRHACELVRRGHLGQLKAVHVQIPTDGPQHEHVRHALEPARPEPVPEGFDWDRWLGPAPDVPYTPARCHFWWRFIGDYGGGEVAAGGVHLIDIAHLAAGKDRTGPVRVRAAGRRNPTGPYDAFLTFDFTAVYADGLKLTGDSKGPRGVRLEGSEGTLFVHVPGGAIEADPPALLSVKLPGFDPEAAATGHHRNFLDAVRTRRPPVCSARAGHHAAAVCHLVNLAMRLDRELVWDPLIERVTGDDEEANCLLNPPPRTPWGL